MTSYTRYELGVGAFVVLGGLALAYLSINLSGLQPFQQRQATLTARFSSIGSLKEGDPVKIAGVTIGSVTAVRLVNYDAEATFALYTPVKLPADSIASIQSAGLLGDSYVSLLPGASDDDLEDGGRITRTEPAVSLTELIAKYAFGSPTDEGSSTKPEPTAVAPAPDTAPEGATAPAAEGAEPGSPAPEEPPRPAKPPVFKDPLE